jgi:hypothetical protein
LVGKYSKAIELTLSDGIVYGAYTYFSPWVTPVYGALTKRHGVSNADRERLVRSNLGTLSPNVPQCGVGVKCT